jgi:acyl-CoA thioesterase-1
MRKTRPSVKAHPDSIISPRRAAPGRQTGFAALGILLIAAFLAGCGGGGPLGEVEDTTTLVCLGDSLTAGYGAAAPGVEDAAQSYPAYLQRSVTIPVINAGVTRDTSADALARIQAGVLSHNPRIVIIELGANDFFQGVPVSTTKTNLQDIIDLLYDGRRKLYLVKFYTPAVARDLAAAYGLNDVVMRLLIAQYDIMFTSLAASATVTLIEDIWEDVWGRHMSDPIHPDAAGYELMAANYVKALGPYLRDHNLLK